MQEEEAATVDQQCRGLFLSVSSFLIMFVLHPLLKNAILAGRGICAASWAVVRWLLVLALDGTVLVSDDDDGDDNHRGGIDDIGVPPPPSRHCEQCARRGTSLSDLAAVLSRLGLAGDDEVDAVSAGGGAATPDVDNQGSCAACAALAAVDELTETKVASEAELREAFYVFDRDEDGFVTPAELWNVMRRLGVPEGARLDDCRRMVAAHDRDGDGRISFQEFRAMMENAA